jgi:ABC-type Fe3+-hydroxamate transport system substrate-binding protein
MEATGIRRAERLPALKLNVLEVDDGTLAGIYESLRKIGAAAGVPERAAALRSNMQAALEDLRRRTRGLAPRRLLFVAGRTPARLEDLIVVGRGSYLNELIEIAGARNAFADVGAPYLKVSLEQVLARNPEVIVDMGEMAQTAGASDEQTRAVVTLWERQPALAAVRERRVFAVASDIFMVPGPRVVEAARALARMVHPEAGL